MAVDADTRLRWDLEADLERAALQFMSSLDYLRGVLPADAMAAYEQTVADATALFQALNANLAYIKGEIDK